MKIIEQGEKLILEFEGCDYGNNTTCGYLPMLGELQRCVDGMTGPHKTTAAFNTRSLMPLGNNRYQLNNIPYHRKTIEFLAGKWLKPELLARTAEQKRRNRIRK